MSLRMEYAVATTQLWTFALMENAGYGFGLSVTIKPGSHMSPMVNDSYSVVIQRENSQRISPKSYH